MEAVNKKDEEIDRLKEELAKTKENYSFLRAALENLPNPIFIKDEDANFVFFNKKYEEFFGMEREKYIGRSVYSLEYLSEEDRERYQKEDLSLIESSSIISYEVDFEAADGNIHPSFYWSKGILDEVSGRRGLIGEIVDISKERDLQDSLNKSLNDLKEFNLKLEHYAETDPGTGIFNRNYLNRMMANGFENKVSTLTPTCIMMFDLDRMKFINDTFGHVKGDEVLKQFADIIQSESREHDVPVRYGGDEFLLIVHNAHLEQGKEIAERIRKRCEKEIILPDGSSATTSIGVSRITDENSLEKIVSKLDTYLYEAKKGGSNKVVSEEE